jgi:hypothetical protein
MLNINTHYDVLWFRRSRLLFLLFLAFFAISPIADAYTDSLCSSPVLFNELNDADSPVSINDLKLNDALDSLHAFNSTAKQNPDDLALSLHALAKDGPACQITRTESSVFAVKSSQCCPPLSSDPSPPVV